MSRRYVLLACSIAALGLAVGGCRETGSPTTELHLPQEWRNAAVDPERGGRFLPDANQELRRFQAAALGSGVPLPKPDYAPARTVVFAVSTQLPRTSSRLAILLQHELPDPETSFLILSDRAAAETARRLGVGDLAADGRVAVEHLEGAYASHPSFPFLRDYAPLVRVRPEGEALKTAELLVFRGSPLNRVIDASLGVARQRDAGELEARFEASEALQRAYARRLGSGVRLAKLDVLMDGGNLITDGRGTCFATDVMIEKNGGDRGRVERSLRSQLGCIRTVFLEPPKRLDEIQHVDTLLFFADPENLVLSMPALYDSDLAAELDNLKQLLSLGYKVHRVPRRTASITYANVLITRTNVYVPQYTLYRVESPRQLQLADEIRRLDPIRDRVAIIERLRRPVETLTIRGGAPLRRDNEVALRVAARLFPNRRVVPVNSDETIGALGSWHCLSHELPEGAWPRKHGTPKVTLEPGSE